MSRVVELDDIERRRQVALDLLMRFKDISAGDLGEQLGLSRQSVQYKRAGQSRIRSVEIRAFAHALAVPVDLFGMEPVGILRWFAEQPAELVVRGQCSVYLTCMVAAYAA